MQNDFYVFLYSKKKNLKHIFSFSFCTIKLNVFCFNIFTYCCFSSAWRSCQQKCLSCHFFIFDQRCHYSCGLFFIVNFFFFLCFLSSTIFSKLLGERRKVLLIKKKATSLPLNCPTNPLPNCFALPSSFNPKPLM